MFRRTLALLAALILTAGFAATAKAASPFDYCPAEADVVLRVDIQKALDTPIAQKILGGPAEEEVQNWARIARNLTDVDLFEDLHEVYLFAKADQDEHTILAVRGNFESPTKLVDIIRVADGYETGEYRGVEVHHWVDDGPKYGAFVEDDILLLAGSEESMGAAIDAAKEGDTGFRSTDAVKYLPADANENLAWGILAPTHGMTGDLGNLARQFEMTLVVAVANMNDQGTVARLTAIPKTKEKATEYLQIVQGAIAMGNLLGNEEPMLGMLARNSTVTLSPDKAAVVATITIPHEILRDQLQELGYLAF